MLQKKKKKEKKKANANIVPIFNIDMTKVIIRQMVMAIAIGN